MHFTNPKFQALDGNGNPLSGGKLYTYAGGGSTARATYSTRDCATTANANPIVLDSRGEAVIYGKGLYKFVLKDPDDVTIWSFDDLLLSGESIWDAARQTGWQTEETWGEDILRADTGGTQRGVIDAGGFQETVSGTNYKFANFRELWGSLQRSQFLWGDATSLLIEPGAYWCREKFCSWAAQLDKTVGTLTSGEWYYVYLDHSAITSGTAIIAAKLLYVVTEPAWDDTYRGWYNGADRCIFAFYADGTNTMDEFIHDGDLVMYANFIADRALAALSQASGFVEVALTIPVFTQKALCTFVGGYGGTGPATMSWETTDQTATTGHEILLVASTATSQYNSMPVIAEIGTGKIGVKSSAETNNTCGVWTDGYFLPNGM